MAFLPFKLFIPIFFAAWSPLCTKKPQISRIQSLMRRPGWRKPPWRNDSDIWTDMDNLLSRDLPSIQWLSKVKQCRYVVVLCFIINWVRWKGPRTNGPLLQKSLSLWWDSVRICHLRFHILRVYHPSWLWKLAHPPFICKDFFLFYGFYSFIARR